MSEIDSIELASRRLGLALEALEAAADRRHEADRGHETLASQVHAFGTDRARLAGALDQAVARTRVLEEANRDVSQRIAQVIDTIRGMLGGEEGRRSE